MDKAAILSAAAKWARAAYRRDRANRYALLAPWTLPPVRCRAVGVAPFRFAGKLVSVVPEVEPPDLDRIVITVLPFTAESGVCDGCTLSPDLRGCVEAALFHDPWYIEMSGMAEATGIPVEDLRRLGDAVFGCLAKSLGAPGPIARIYHAAVRWFGGLFHGHLGAMILAAILAAMVAGCSGGCAMPDILDGPVPAPTFERAGNGGN